MWKNSTARHGSLQIAAHWLVVLLIVAVYVTMECRGYFPRGSDARSIMKALHYALGICVLLLGVARLAGRMSGPAPSLEPPPSPWQDLLAKMVHCALYAFMIGMPILGWLLLSARGRAIPLFGFELPPLVAPDKGLAHTVAELHETVAALGYWLIGAHAAAALLHHYVARDNTLARMLPWARRMES
jgi:cytochrome b561